MVSQAKRGVVHPLVVILGCARSVQHGQHSQRQLGHPNHAGLHNTISCPAQRTQTHTHTPVCGTQSLPQPALAVRPACRPP